jgi:hypothetical protein
LKLPSQAFNYQKLPSQAFNRLKSSEAFGTELFKSFKNEKARFRCSSSISLQTFPNLKLIQLEPPQNSPPKILHFSISRNAPSQLHFHFNSAKGNFSRHPAAVALEKAKNNRKLCNIYAPRCDYLIYAAS